MIASSRTGSTFYGTPEEGQAQEKGGRSLTVSSRANNTATMQQDSVMQGLQMDDGHHVDPLKEQLRSYMQQDVPMPIAAVQTLLNVLAKSKAVTIMGLEAELKETTEKLKTYESSVRDGRKSMSLPAVCEQFFRHVTRSNDDDAEFELVKKSCILRGEMFVARALKGTNKIATMAHHFLQDSMVVLTHGNSRVVQAVLQEATKTKNFSVLVTEGRPEGSGYRAAEQLAQAKIPVTLILDSAVGYVMEKVDIVMLGAEGVVESGGIVNKIGSYQIAMAAKLFNKPVYVAAESYKFVRVYPLTQADLQQHRDDQLPLTPCVKDPDFKLPSGVELDNPPCDYTPSNYITLLFTDLGILTPAAVSDELIRLYQ